MVATFLTAQYTGNEKLAVVKSTMRYQRLNVASAGDDMKKEKFCNICGNVN